MCRAPVTLGGGMTMVNGFRAGSGRLWKKPCSFQKVSHFWCTSLGSYCLGSSIVMKESPGRLEPVLCETSYSRQRGADDVPLKNDNSCLRMVNGVIAGVFSPSGPIACYSPGCGPALTKENYMAFWRSFVSITCALALCLFV